MFQNLGPYFLRPCRVVRVFMMRKALFCREGGREGRANRWLYVECELKAKQRKRAASHPRGYHLAEMSEVVERTYAATFLRVLASKVRHSRRTRGLFLNFFSDPFFPVQEPVPVGVLHELFDDPWRHRIPPLTRLRRGSGRRASFFSAPLLVMARASDDDKSTSRKKAARRRIDRLMGQEDEAIIMVVGWNTKNE